MAARFNHDTFVVRRKVLTFFGKAAHAYAGDGSLLLYTKLKAFKLKEDIRIYADETMQQEVLSIKARNIIDFGASYDVFEGAERVGMLRRKGWKSSFVRDEWVLFDADEKEIGFIREDSAILGLLRRYIELVSFLVPQAYHVEVGGRQIAHFKQNFNPFVFKLGVDFTADQTRTLDRRLGVAAAMLLVLIEGKQG